MSNFGLLPVFLLLITIIISAIATFSFLSKRLGFNSRKGVYTKLSIYVVVAALSMILVYTIPHEEPIKKVSNINLDQIPNIFALSAEQWDEKTIAQYEVYVETFPFKQDDLIIEGIIDTMHYSTIHVVIEESDEYQDEIQVIVYQTPSIYLDYEITDAIDHYKFGKKDNQLNIIDEERQVSLTIFRTPFSFRLFEKDSPPMFDDRAIVGEQLVHVKVPKGTTVTKTNDDVNLIHVY
ncbi:MAG TPA: hypothetical protein VK061_09765 [Bacillota bacterium]|nr:hypothetical protein [Bacillota bacterium]